MLPRRRKMMTRPLLYSRITVSLLALALSGFLDVASRAQDIAGGASVFLASAEVEAKLGKGIFTPAPNRAHAPKDFEKKTVARSVRAAHPQRQTTTSTTAGNTQTTNNGGATGSRPLESTRPLGGPARRVMGAEDYNKQGDDFFDAGQYDKAAESYQQALHMKADYPQAFLNLRNPYFNLSRSHQPTPPP